MHWSLAVGLTVAWVLVGVFDMYIRISDENERCLDVLDFVTIVVLGCIVGPCVLAYDLLNSAFTRAKGK